MYHVTIKTDEGAEPVLIAEVSNYIKYDEGETAENSLITSLIVSAREMIERFLNVSLKSKTYVLEFDSSAVDDYLIDIPYCPVASVTSLIQINNEGTETTLTKNTDYYERGAQFRSLYLPNISSDYYYKLEYVAGYGSPNEAIPSVLKDVIKDLVMYWYQREGEKQIPEPIKAKILTYSRNYYI